MQTTDTEVLRFHFVMIFFFFSLCLSAPKIDYFQLGYFDVFFCVIQTWSRTQWLTVCLRMQHRCGYVRSIDERMRNREREVKQTNRKKRKHRQLPIGLHFDLSFSRVKIRMCNDYEFSGSSTTYKRHGEKETTKPSHYYYSIS